MSCLAMAGWMLLASLLYHACSYCCSGSPPACLAMHAVTVARMSSLQCEWYGRPSVLTGRENAPVALAVLCWHLRPARMLWCSGPFTLRPAVTHVPTHAATRSPDVTNSVCALPLVSYLVSLPEPSLPYTYLDSLVGAAGLAWSGACCQWGDLLVVVYQGGVVGSSPPLFLAQVSGTSCSKVRRSSRYCSGDAVLLCGEPMTRPFSQKKKKTEQDYPYSSSSSKERP